MYSTRCKIPAPWAHLPFCNISTLTSAVMQILISQGALATYLISMQVLGQADFVIEAINEDESSKKAAFLLLDKAGCQFSCNHI